MRFFQFTLKWVVILLGLGLKRGTNFRFSIQISIYIIFQQLRDAAVEFHRTKNVLKNKKEGKMPSISVKLNWAVTSNRTLQTAGRPASNSTSLIATIIPQVNV